MRAAAGPGRDAGGRMTARLIAISRPVVEGVAGAEQLLAYCARVSSAANQNNHATGARLIKSLIRRKEWSPLEMVSLTIEIETTRDIARQILRHRSFSFQEFSQRYAAVGALTHERECRMRHPSDRQSSLPCADETVANWWRRALISQAEHSKRLYEAALGLGIAKEQARALLPEGLTPSRLYMAGTLRSWLHYCHLRMGPETQAEHRAVAEACWNIVVEQFPVLA